MIPERTLGKQGLESGRKDIEISVWNRKKIRGLGFGWGGGRRAYGPFFCGGFFSVTDWPVNLLGKTGGLAAGYRLAGSGAHIQRFRLDMGFSPGQGYRLALNNKQGSRVRCLTS